MNEKFQIDMKEIEPPETLYIRDIENRVFQTIALQTLSSIEGVSVWLEGNLIDNFLGREASDRLKGIHVDQDQKNRSVKLKMEVNVEYGIPLPQKAIEIQTKVSREISRITGLHVSCIHVVFRNLIIPKKQAQELQEIDTRAIVEGVDYSEEF